MTEIKKSNERLERKQITDALTSVEADIAALQASVAGISSMTVEIFESSGTFTVPGGVDYVWITGCGGGGGGGLDTTAGDGGGGGGGAESANEYPIYLGASPPATVSITIGAGGAGRSGSTGIGTDGAASTFGTYLTLDGGQAGTTQSGGGGGGAGGGALVSGDTAGNPGTGVGIIGGGSGGGGAETGSTGYAGGSGYASSWDIVGSTKGGNGGGSYGRGGYYGVHDPGYGGGGGGSDVSPAQTGGGGIIIVRYLS
jgi:hypothetical protein